ncbi:MAG TPA: protein-glutamate O-methyltransferase CheR [Armatimonadota bacterium]
MTGKEQKPNMGPDLTTLELSDDEFNQISKLVYRLCGINLHAGKSGLVKARLMKRLRLLGIASFDEYIRHVESDAYGQELTAMLDALTTNKTSFFREDQHFVFLRENVLPGIVAAGKPIRIWSAGCSTGEEPYTLGITLREEIPDIDRRDVRILATDLSTRVLDTAREAIYDEERLRDVPPELVHKHFHAVRTAPPRTWRVNNDIRKVVHLARLNLMEDWPMRGPFDAIFCRNVMIYFDKQTQQTLTNRFAQLLKPGGYLFVGHSESLSSWASEFRYVQPAVYVK